MPGEDKGDLIGHGQVVLRLSSLVSPGKDIVRYDQRGLVRRVL